MPFTFQTARLHSYLHWNCFNGGISVHEENRLVISNYYRVRPFFTYFKGKRTRKENTEFENPMPLWIVQVHDQDRLSTSKPNETRSPWTDLDRGSSINQSVSHPQLRPSWDNPASNRDTPGLRREVTPSVECHLNAGAFFRPQACCLSTRISDGNQ